MSDCTVRSPLRSRGGRSHAAAIKAMADASTAKDARISELERGLRMAGHWLRSAHGKTIIEETAPGITETRTLDMSPGINVMSTTTGSSLLSGAGPKSSARLTGSERRAASTPFNITGSWLEAGRHR